MFVYNVKHNLLISCVSFLSLFLFPPDEHRESRQDPAQNQTMGEVNGSMYFRDHATPFTNKALALSVGVT
jgi:hypothetical protein